MSRWPGYAVRHERIERSFLAEAKHTSACSLVITRLARPESTTGCRGVLGLRTEFVFPFTWIPVEVSCQKPLKEVSVYDREPVYLLWSMPPRVSSALGVSW